MTGGHSPTTAWLVSGLLSVYMICMVSKLWKYKSQFVVHCDFIASIEAMSLVLRSCFTVGSGDGIPQPPSSSDALGTDSSCVWTADRFLALIRDEVARVPTVIIHLPSFLRRWTAPRRPLLWLPCLPLSLLCLPAWALLLQRLWATQISLLDGWFGWNLVCMSLMGAWHGQPAGWCMPTAICG